MESVVANAPPHRLHAQHGRPEAVAWEEGGEHLQVVQAAEVAEVDEVDEVDEVERASREQAVQLAGERALGPGAERWELIVAHESAVRGLDLPQLQLVVITMMPKTPEAYIHISGRTGRAGRSGRCVSIFTRTEVDRAGLITRSLQNVSWKISRDGEGEAVEEAESADARRGSTKL